ncbi:hypothetical protein [Curtobacterium flaccumfaciens]|uniref:ORC-CDC6 family AAA ATPase n=1 Tax=Curtobacterium flaccumfaciens TaxID=2035 RepID=UPI00265B25A9|nr:hypothetical protein [Curtobacterium flaccumfaciens]MCS5506765.1 hypothetical protein [Curtobacterium flaccumfaciens pv. flaccumfaciens]
MQNPFEVTKAVDFSDDEIERTFIPFDPDDDQLILDPTSPMPHFLVGAKGGGRTHLMRHLASLGTLDNVVNSGFLGIYFRCSGLNGSRFRGAALDAAGWAAIFAFYMDVWLSEQLLRSSLELLKGEIRDQISALVSERLDDLVGMARSDDEPQVGPLKRLSEIRRGIDSAVNNAPIIGTVEVPLLAAPGELVFALATSISVAIEKLRGARIVFLVDEYENLSLEQQMYFNTLVREKEPPATFIIGGRRWGIKTQLTLSGGEENKQGSEYEWTVLEDRYRQNGPAYKRFCVEMLDQRVSAAGLDPEAQGAMALLYGSSPGLADRRLPSTGKFFRRLASALRSAAVPPDEIAFITERLNFEGREFYSRLAVLRFYIKWSESPSASLSELAIEAREFVGPLLSDSSATKEAMNFRALRRSDIEAQMYSDAGRALPYLGGDALIQMSGFIPRNLLMTLKYVMRWAMFYGETALEDGVGVSEQAQCDGVLEASRWFAQDAEPLGREGADCRRAIQRFGKLLQSIRLSDKPSEVAVCSFSSDLVGVPQAALEVLENCVNHGMLIRIDGGRSGRNEGTKHAKYQLHPMIAPTYGVSTSRRGDLTLTGPEVSRIFDPQVPESAFGQLVRSKVERMTAPFGISTSGTALF